MARLRYPTVIFDMDGTLFKTDAGVLNAFRYALEKLGKTMPNVPGDAFIGPPLRYSFTELCGLKGAEAEQAVDFHREYYGVTGYKEAEFYPGMRDLLPALRDAGATVCLATSKYKIMAEKVMDHFGIRDFVAHAAMSDGTERLSGKQGLVQSVLDQAGAAPENAVMIGDTWYDAEGAHACGVPFIGVLYGYGTQADMQKFPAVAFAKDVSALRSLLLL